MKTPSGTDRITVDLSTLLGLRTHAHPIEWSRLRAAQLFAGRRLAMLLLAANLVAATVCTALMRTSIASWQLAAWFFGVAAISSWVAFRRLATPHRGNGHASIRDIRSTFWEGLALALAWIVVPAFFCSQASPGTTAGLGITLAVLMTAAAFAMAPLTLATLIFLGYLGAALAVHLVLTGAIAAAIGMLVFSALLMILCVDRARALVVMRASEITLDERDETVSLLLREFEDIDADWLWETDAARRIVKASPRFAVACGLDPVAIDGLPLLQVLAGSAWTTGDFAPGLRTLAEKMKARESFRDLRLPVQIDGTERWWEIAASPRLDDRGQFCGFRGVGSDVTEQRASADKINRMARFDTLTGLPNRLMVNETLTRALTDADKIGGRCAFMMLDLDRFKAVNDTLGHPIGDRLLGRVAERLDHLMGENAMCGRLGGDEFAVTIRDASDLAAVEGLAQRIIESLSRPYEIDQHTLYIGASVGLAIGPRDGRTAEMLIRSADLALYRAKDAGRGVFQMYEPELHAQAEERRLLDMALRSAIEKGEMHLDYQPVVDAHSGDVQGFEALLRWTSPQFGMVPPDKFIPLAKDARLIAPIGAWVLRTACEEAMRWPPGIRIAINVSSDQLQNPSFVTTVTSALAASGLSAERLELEVTESMFMRKDVGATKVLERLLSMGVRLSLDDFGTGYSSLGYLSRTRFSSVKIDRSFVEDAANGVREAIAIIRAVVALADSLGMTTTAEGVETEMEHRMVQDFGCTAAQGYYFGRPLPVAEARELASRRWHAAA